MFTQCPHCQTLFRIRSQHLQAAEGQVRCSRCDETFNAEEHLQLPSKVDSGDGTHIEEPLLVSPLASDSGVRPDQRAATVARETPEATSPRPDTESDASHHDQTLDETTDTTAEFHLLLEDSLAAGDEKSGDRRHTLGWTLGSLLLLLLLATQVGWVQQAWLMETPQARALLQPICERLGCNLPQRRALEQFKVLDRSITSYTGHAGALLLQLTFSNTAEFAQPYPALQLSLFDQNQALTARRRFPPDDYLPASVSGHSLLAPGEAVKVELTLADPGETITGFQFDFR